MTKRNIRIEDRVITGHFDGQPIWREKTPEEKLESRNDRLGFPHELGNLYIGIDSTRKVGE